MKGLVISVFTFFFALAVVGQSVTPEMRTAANDAFQKQDWPAAIKTYETAWGQEERRRGKAP
jgi:hypothetical protein